MIVEGFIASIVSMLLSTAGVSATANGDIIYVPSLDHKFIVTLSCADLMGVLLQAFIYGFVVWIYVVANGRSLRRRTYLILGFTGFVAFFLANMLRMFTEIYLLAKVYGPVYQHYLLTWQAFEEQVGIAVMFATLLVLLLPSYLFLKRDLKIPSSFRDQNSNQPVIRAGTSRK